MTSLLPRLKLNGINTPESCRAALDGPENERTDFIGFIFTRHPNLAISPAEAGMLASHIPPTTSIVGIFRDPLDAELEECFGQTPVDILQLNGSESPARIHELRQQFGLPVIKSLALGTAEDMAAARDYAHVADYLLFTARAGAGISAIGTYMHEGDWPFDWSLLEGAALRQPWFLSGGIAAHNLSAALTATSAQLVDITSGILGKNGKCCPEKIAEVLAKRRDLSPILAPTILE